MNVTVRDIREAIADLPDDTQVWISTNRNGDKYHPIDEIQKTNMILDSFSMRFKPAILLWPDDERNAWGPG